MVRQKATGYGKWWKRRSADTTFIRIDDAGSSLGRSAIGVPTLSRMIRVAKRL
jgi:hypothetical protein